VEADLGQQNIVLASAWRKAAIRDDWRCIVDTATLQREYAIKEERKKTPLFKDVPTEVGVYWCTAMAGWPFCCHQ